MNPAPGRNALTKRPTMHEAVTKTEKELKAALDSYAKDFGEPAAKQLQRYARAQVKNTDGGR